LIADSTMIRFFQPCARGLSAVGLFALATSLAVGQSAAASLRGEVKDYSGARIAGVAIAVIGADGRVKFTVSDPDGRYFVKDLLPGRYTVWAWSRGFALYEDSSLLVTPARDAALDIPLEVGNPKPGTSGRDLFRIAYDPARNLGRGVKSNICPAQRGMLSTRLSTDFRPSFRADSVGGLLGQEARP